MIYYRHDSMSLGRILAIIGFMAILYPFNNYLSFSRTRARARAVARERPQPNRRARNASDAKPASLRKSFIAPTRASWYLRK